MRTCLAIHHDPGPCPVDDAPHHTCTSTTGEGSSVTTAVRRPRVLDYAPAPPVVEDLAPVTFTTGTYKRAQHGPGRKRPAPSTKGTRR